MQRLPGFICASESPIAPLQSAEMSSMSCGAYHVLFVQEEVEEALMRAKETTSDGSLTMERYEGLVLELEKLKQQKALAEDAQDMGTHQMEALLLSRSELTHQLDEVRVVALRCTWALQAVVALVRVTAHRTGVIVRLHRSHTAERSRNVFSAYNTFCGVCYFS